MLVALFNKEDDVSTVCSSSLVQPTPVEGMSVEEPHDMVQGRVCGVCGSSLEYCSVWGG